MYPVFSLASHKSTKTEGVMSNKLLLSVVVLASMNHAPAGIVCSERIEVIHR